MVSPMKFSLVVFVAALAATIGAPVRNVDVSAIENDAEIARRFWDVPGIAVIVVSRDQTLTIKGLGLRDIEAKAPVTPDTIFPLASCSKSFTTALAAMLVDEGKLNWDDPVRKYLTSFHLADSLADQSVTLRDLFTHRTGLASHDFLWYRSSLPLTEIIQRAGQLPLEKPFRTAFQYQSVMYSAAGLAVANAGHDSWEDLIRKRIFEPLHMSSASCRTPPDGKLERATPYKANAEGRLRAVPWYQQSEPNPAGSIHLSARDLASWLRFQISDGMVGDRRLVSAAGLKETHTPQIVIRMDEGVRAMNPDTQQISYGMGWVIQDYRGHLLVSHGGIIDGFRAHIALLPNEGFAWAILCNRHQTRLTLSLSNTIADRLLGLTPRDWNAYFKATTDQIDQHKREIRRQRDAARRPDQPPSVPLSQLEGQYEYPPYGQAQVQFHGGELTWKWSGFEGKLSHHHGNVFELANEQLEDPLIEFLVESGRVTGFAFLNLPFAKK